MFVDLEETLIKVSSEYGSRISELASDDDQGRQSFPIYVGLRFGFTQQ
jgi:hypothetical protein